ncbi:MAG: flippase-like domain-containing protein [Rhodobacteraceae bacterium]|nr:flippase-like domain-containing protein [Paracoccaceae bacterium]
MTGCVTRRVWPLIRICVAAVFLVALFRVIDFTAAVEVLAELDVGTILLVIALFGAGQVLSSLRWRLALLQIMPAPPSLPALLRLYLVGMFVNLGIPTMAGGDLVRAEFLRRAVGARGGAYASIVVDRLIGVLAVTMVAAVAALAAGDIVEADTKTAVLKAAVALAVGMAGAAFVLRQLNGGLWERLDPFLSAIKTIARRPGVLSICLAIAVAVQTLAVILPISLLAKAMGIDVALSSHFVLVPIIILITLLPISPNGLGLRETAFVVLYGQFGILAEQAFALGFAWSLVLTAFGLLGGALLFISGADIVPGRKRHKGPVG